MTHPTQKWIVTGAAGFIGSNTVARLLERGDEVVGFDNLSRAGTEQNLEWLSGQPGAFEFVRGDVRNPGDVEDLVARHSNASVLLHLAGQVAVTTSIRFPREDFEANALGTFNVCEAVRLHALETTLLYASTNKVYGSELGRLELDGDRWTNADQPEGISEAQPIDLHSPYACSKGLGDLYVLDYARIYGLRAASLRQSCIYGPRQFGIEDQGWVAWLTLAALSNTPFTIFGDGRQVRDILYVDDLVDFYLACAANADAVAGQAINVGGGPENQLSLLELVARLEHQLGRTPDFAFAPSRPGDQRYYVSDVRYAEALLGWKPATSVEAGFSGLANWLEANLPATSQATQAGDGGAPVATAD
jgi:CDP-paratose 2-epimerase